MWNNHRRTQQKTLYSLSRNKITPFPARQIAVLRAQPTTNPLENFNVTSMNLVPADTLVKHGTDYAYVGGDEAVFEYSFLTKVAGSNAECPLKIYECYNASIMSPTTMGNMLTGWGETLSQSSIDKIKAVSDGLTATFTNPTNGVIAQLMAELDLTPLLTLFGTNALLKSSVKSITVDVYAKGEGSNGGVLASGCQGYWWKGTSWVSVSMGNLTNSIALMSDSSTSTSPNYIDSSNRFRLLLVPKYPADNTYQSSITIDSIQLKITFSKSADMVQPKQVYLPSTWSMLVRGISPSWDNNSATKDMTLLSLYINNNNRYYVVYRYSSKIISFVKIKDGVSSAVNTAALTLNKYQVVNVLVGQSSAGMFMWLLLNNGTTLMYSNTDGNAVIGAVQLYPLALHISGYEGNAYYELDQLNPYYVPKDITEADAILRGTAGNRAGIINKNLFSLDKVSLHANATRDLATGIITLNATGAWQNNTIDIPVLPNNKYVLNAIITQSASYGYIQIEEFYNNISLGNVATAVITTNKTVEFTAKPNTNKIRLKIGGSVTGTFTFKDIDFRLKM